MRNAVTTGLSEMQREDSDSVNLGSNPSPPATEITEISGEFGSGHPGPERHAEPPGRTEPGTAPHIRSLLDALERQFPNDLAIMGRVRMVRRHLALEVGGKAAPAIKQETTRIITELGDLIADRGRMVTPREERA